MKQRLITGLLCMIPFFVFAQRDSLNPVSAQSDSLPRFFAPRDTVSRVYTLQEIFSLALANSQDIKVSSTQVDVARQNIAIERNQQLPALSSSLSAGYLGNALIIPKNFKHTTTVKLPHFLNDFSLQASELIFKGNSVNYSIDLASLQTQIAQLNLDKKTQDIKLMAAGYYFDLMNDYKQLKVYHENIHLQEAILDLANQFFTQGIITRDYVYRFELQIANLNYEVASLENDMRVLNKQLDVITGIPDTVAIIPDTALLLAQPFVENLLFYQQEALQKLPDNKIAGKDVEVSEKQLSLTRTERVPSVSAFGANALQRPVTSGSPALDAYSNGWQVGLSLDYDISSLYTTPKKITQNKLQIREAKQQLTLQQQNASVEVEQAYLKLKTAQVNAATQEKNVKLADETYRIVQQKFQNQLAIVVDVLNATDEKLSAELQKSNAQVNVLYSYIQLLRASGDL